MTQGVITAFQQAANDDNKPAMIVIDTIDAALGFQLAGELQSRPHSVARDAAIVDMTPDTNASPNAQDSHILDYTREMSQAVAVQQPIIALVNLAGLDEADRRVALTGIALGLNYDVRAYHIIPPADDTDEPPVFAGGMGGGVGDLDFQHIAGAPDAPAMAKLIAPEPSSGKPGPGRKKTAAKKPGKGGPKK